MINQKFDANEADENLYFRRKEDKIIICSAYVDDFLIATNHEGWRNDLLFKRNE